MMMMKMIMKERMKKQKNWMTQKFNNKKKNRIIDN